MPVFDQPGDKPLIDALRASGAFFAHDWAVRVAIAVLLLIVTWRVGRLGRRWLERAGASRVDPNIRYLSGQLVYWLVLALGLVFILGLLGVDPSVLLATFGAAWLALGLAAQDVVKSFLAGLYLMFERPFLIGDEIEVREKVGRVERVGFRATTLLTGEDVRIIVPNIVIFNEVVINRSHAQAAGPGSTHGAIAE
jgi:small conductance mechanosensitive channel